MITTNSSRSAPKFNSLNEYLADIKSRDQHKIRLADKLFHTVRSGQASEIQETIRQCSKADVKIDGSKHDYLLEYFDSFRSRINSPDIIIVRLLISYQKVISNKARLAFYQNVFYRGLLSQEDTTEMCDLINGEQQNKATPC